MSSHDVFFSLSDGSFRASEVWGGTIKRGLFKGARAMDQRPVLISTRVVRDGRSPPDSLAWTFQGLAPVLFYGEPDPGPDVSAGATGFHIVGVVEELPEGIRVLERSGSWNVSDCARIGLGLCDLAAEAARNAIVLQFMRPEVVFANEEEGRWKYSGATVRSYAHLGHGGDARQRSPYGDRSYMAPEIQLGEEVTSASDMFSIGLVLWELSSGEHAFGDAPIPAEELASRRPYAGPVALRRLVERATARAPHERQTLEELHNELTRLASAD